MTKTHHHPSTIRENDLGPREWNALATHPMQSWEWGEVRKHEGKRIVRLIQKDEQGNDAQVYLLTIHPIPFSPYAIGYVPKSFAPTLDLVNYLKPWAKKYGVIFIKFEPNILKDEWKSIHVPRLIMSPHPLFTMWNQTLDIARTEQELMATMHPKTRYNIRLAQRKHVTTEVLNNEEGYQIFERLYFDTCMRQRYKGHIPAYHRNVWVILNERQQSEYVSGQTGLQNHIIVARYNAEPLAAYQLWQFKDTMYYVYGGSSDTHKNVMAPNLLMWEALLLAKQLGCTRFDMWGSLPPNHNSSDPWAGFTKFKQGYGTQFVQYAGSFDLVINLLLYKLYTTAHHIRQKIVL
ncbi:MAG TPA: peptidoglycan bridge formation glycyltransferase FemA/FemB family protein [Candidatus Woesebacteria bacterium]|nr:peptidoglycan bridge formation glycyltransferase FemA/FemB family protein [Candidatus Woesebacteria bacterium]HNS94586.1 peptidoglycan bridge formation glycyltransferase FemA/FemB family protein [Candidatus Woesebacteria bacterium]